MLNRTYNNIIRLLGFLTTVVVVIAKVLGWTDQSWMIIWIPILLTFLFGSKDEEHIYMVKNVQEIEDNEGIEPDDVEPQEPEDDDNDQIPPSGPKYGI